MIAVLFVPERAILRITPQWWFTLQATWQELINTTRQTERKYLIYTAIYRSKGLGEGGEGKESPRGLLFGGTSPVPAISYLSSLKAKQRSDLACKSMFLYVYTGLVNVGYHGQRPSVFEGELISILWKMVQLTLLSIIVKHTKAGGKCFNWKHNCIYTLPAFPFLKSNATPLQNL